MLLICACAVVSGARTITEITECGQRATTTVLERLGIRRHLPGRRRAPSHATLTRLLAALDGDALDAVIGAYLAGHDHTDAGTTDSAPRPAIAVDGKALSGSAHRQQRHRHLLSAVTHAPTVRLAQREVRAKTNETAAFRPLLEPLDLTGTVVTFDALHSVKDQVRWLVQEKKAHYIAVIKGNQPTASAQLKTLPWEQVPVAHTVSGTGHGRRESRSVKTLAIAANLGGIAFPQARLALRIHRRRQENGKRQTRETVYAVTSLDTHQASPADLGGYVRGHWGNRKFQPPHQRCGVRRGRLHRPHRQRAAGDGRSAEPGHRQAAAAPQDTTAPLRHRRQAGQTTGAPGSGWPGRRTRTGSCRTTRVGPAAAGLTWAKPLTKGSPDPIRFHEAHPSRTTGTAEDPGGPTPGHLTPEEFQSLASDALAAGAAVRSTGTDGVGDLIR
ncbi:ISAs1 family transposase [Streptomyces sp. NPDC002680]|uniref:ISAs1 family transposase n=1 Tax=Streptomyces sp. NPDC002680 TaxID=3364659 RepID=UPI0036A16D75